MSILPNFLKLRRLLSCGDLFIHLNQGYDAVCNSVTH